MDYSDIRWIMNSRGMANDPAFLTANYSIHPIPRFNGCPLGLYFPLEERVPELGLIPEGTIIVPPQAEEGTLFHELGHRHGDYYFNDLSEGYAEQYRKRYQKGAVARLYTGSDFERLPAFGRLFEEGERGAVEVSLAAPLLEEEVADISRQLDYGVERAHLISRDSTLRVEFTQGFDWPTIIAGVMAGSVAVLVGILGYSVYKIAKEAPWVFPVALVTTLLAVGGGLYFASRRYLPTPKRA